MKPDQLTHADVAQPHADDVQQLREAFHDLRLHQRGAVGQDGIRFIQSGVEPVIRQTPDHLADHGRRQQIAEGQIDRDHAVRWRSGFVGIDEEASGSNLTQSFPNRGKVPHLGGALEDVQSATR